MLGPFDGSESCSWSAAGWPWSRRSRLGEGPAIPVRITVTVTGGAGRAGRLRWGGTAVPEFCGSNGHTSGLDGVSFLSSTGSLAGRSRVPVPRRGLAGPKYEITYRAVSRGVVMTAHQDLYPFGPGRRSTTRSAMGYTLRRPAAVHHRRAGWLDHGADQPGVDPPRPRFTVPAPPATAWATAPEAAANAPASPTTAGAPSVGAGRGRTGAGGHGGRGRGGGRARSGARCAPGGHFLRPPQRPAASLPGPSEATGG